MIIDNSKTLCMEVMLSPPELVSVLHLGEGDDGVGDAGPNVRPHYHRDRSLHWHVSSHQPDDDGGGGGRRLETVKVKISNKLLLISAKHLQNKTRNT